MNFSYHLEVNDSNVCASDPLAFPHISTGSVTNDSAVESEASVAALCLDLLSGNTDFGTKSRTNAGEVKDILPTSFFCDHPDEAPSLSRSTSSSLRFSEISESNHLAKLDRINQLLAEAAELQREVFG